LARDPLKQLIRRIVRIVGYDNKKDLATRPFAGMLIIWAHVLP